MRKKKKPTYEEQISCRVKRHAYKRLNEIAELKHRTQNDVIRLLLDRGIAAFDRDKKLFEPEEEGEEEEEEDD